jgi:cytochrome c oxidase assembly protein subunit 15
MVHWKPLHFLPPLNEVQWQEEFQAYSQSPEFKHFNSHFSLQDFKKIYFWEYLHRLTGRIIGLVFLIPFLYFLLTKRIKEKALIFKLLIIFLWGGLQGFIGWYMVKSGLVDNPHVSHFRLAIHLLTAFTMGAYIYWVTLGLKYPDLQKGKLVTKIPIFLFLLTLFQITYGAFTAGLKAGYIYPTYPLMGSRFIPDEAWETYHDYGIQSWVENPSWVQFIHRWLGLVLVLSIIWGYYRLKKLPLSQKQENVMITTLFVVIFQFILGILTLILKMPISLAILHQWTAFILLLMLVRVIYYFKKP